jgi:hypothetical protein
MSSTGIMTIFLQVKQVLTKKRWIDQTNPLDGLGIALIRKQIDFLAVETSKYLLKPLWPYDQLGKLPTGSAGNHQPLKLEGSFASRL